MSNEPPATTSGDFSFPALQAPQPTPPARKPLLTAQSTVVHAGAPGSSAASAPVPVSRLARAEGRRNKVPLEKGFSQVDWLRLARTGKDLTGGAGRRREIPLSEVAQHRSAEDAWMVLQGRVYNITPYLAFHPGGVAVLMGAAGRDGTALFNKYHPWVNGHALLEPCLLGRLQQAHPQPQQAEQGEGPGRQQRQPQQPQVQQEQQQQQPPPTAKEQDQQEGHQEQQQGPQPGQQVGPRQL